MTIVAGTGRSSESKLETLWKYVMTTHVALMEQAKDAGGVAPLVDLHKIFTDGLLNPDTI